MGYRVITISREFGSGGRTIGKMLAESLGIRCYDREIIGEVASKSGLTEKYIEDKGEYTRGGISRIFTNRSFYNGPTNEDNIWKLQSQMITELAEKEPCVIVGRCADYILRDWDDVLRVFIHADTKARAERIVKVYGEQQDSPEKRLKDKDKRRAAYYQYYTDMVWGDARNYHISLDSGVLGIDKCVEILKSL